MNKTVRLVPGTAPIAARCSPIATAVAAGRTVTLSLSLGHFLHEFVEGLFHVDSRFWRTLRALVHAARPAHRAVPDRQAAAVFAAVSQLSRHLDPVLRPGFDLRLRGIESGEHRRSARCRRPTARRLAANPGWGLRLVPDLEAVLRACTERRSPGNRLGDAEPAAEGDVRRVAAGRAGAVLGLSATAAVLPRESRLRAALPVVLLHGEHARVAVGGGHRGARRRRGQDRRAFEFALYRGASSTCLSPCVACIAPACSRPCSDCAALAVSYVIFYALGVSVAGMYAFLRA